MYLVYPPRIANSPKLATFRAWLHAEIAADQTEKPAAVIAPHANEIGTVNGEVRPIPQ
jgi:hypothetical protein